MIRNVIPTFTTFFVPHIVLLLLIFIIIPVFVFSPISSYMKDQHTHTAHIHTVFFFLCTPGFGLQS